MKATYDSAGRMVAEKWYDSANTLTAHYKYVYDGQGNIVRSLDIFGKKEYDYEYDEERILRATEATIEISGENITSKVIVPVIRYKYDSDGNLISKHFEDKNGATSNYSYIDSLENPRTAAGNYIICQWNSLNDISDGAHFYAVNDSAGVLTPYNGAGNYTSALSNHYNDFASMISYNNGGSMIYAYRIG